MIRWRPHIRWWTWARRICAGTFLALLVLGQFPWFPWFKGSTTSASLFGTLQLADPLAALEVTLAARRVETSLLLAAGLLVVLYALLGRAFCGWICPLGLLLDLNDGVRRRVRRLLERIGLRLPELRLPSKTKYFLLGLALGVSLMLSVPAFQIVSPINIFAWAVIFNPGPEWLLLIGIVVVEFFSRRLWCRALCPLGALYSLIGRFAPLRVRVNPEQAGAAHCADCTASCPMGIRVMEDYAEPAKPSVSDPECIRCGSCVDACPSGLLRLGVKRGG